MSEYCSSCGSGIDEADAFCGVCGASSGGQTTTVEGHAANAYCNNCGSPFGEDATYAFCVKCGAAKRQHDGSEGSRLPLDASIPEVILVATVTASIVPFIQSIAAAAGQDTYSKLKSFLKKQHQPDSPPDAIRVADSSRSLSLSLDLSHVGPDEAQQLLRLNLSDARLHDGTILCLDGWRFYGNGITLIWNDRRAKWQHEGRRRAIRRSRTS